MFDPQINNKTIHQMKNQSLKKNQFSFEVISYQFALFFCPKNKQDSRNKKISINWKKYWELKVIIKIEHIVHIIQKLLELVWQKLKLIRTFTLKVLKILVFSKLKSYLIYFNISFYNTRYIDVDIKYFILLLLHLNIFS